MTLNRGRERTSEAVANVPTARSRELRPWLSRRKVAKIRRAPPVTARRIDGSLTGVTAVVTRITEIRRLHSE